MTEITLYDSALVRERLPYVFRFSKHDKDVIIIFLIRTRKTETYWRRWRLITFRFRKIQVTLDGDVTVQSLVQIREEIEALKMLQERLRMKCAYETLGPLEFLLACHRHRESGL